MKKIAAKLTSSTKPIKYVKTVFMIVNIEPPLPL